MSLEVFAYGSKSKPRKRKKQPKAAFCVFFETALLQKTKFGAGNETRTRDPDLGKVVLYQLSYSRNNGVP